MPSTHDVPVPDSPSPVLLDPDEPAVPPKWWGGCCGCFLFLVSAAVTIAIAVIATKVLARFLGT